MSASVLTTQTRDNLFGTEYPQMFIDVTIDESQTLARGAVIGLKTVAAGTAAADAGNTGDGAISAFALAAGGPAKIGTYLATCVEAVTNSGVFHVTDPDGVLIGQLTVAVSSNTTFTGDGITFNIADGATDFAVDDFFTLPITAGNGRGILLDKDATDGSEVFYGVLTSAVTTAASATASASVAIAGSFQTQALSFASGTAYTDVIDAARDKNCYFEYSDADNNAVGD